MKLNIQKFATSDAWTLQTYLKDYKYNSKGELTQITVKIESNYNIGSIYDIDSENNENWAYGSWDVHEGTGSYPYSETPYIERTFKNLNNLKGVKLTCYETSSTENRYIYYNFTMTTDEDASTTYITKTSATAVLKGNVVNNLSTYDWNNAPSIGAVRNYFESGSVVQSQKEWLKDLILETTHPIGSLEINTTGINPSEYLGGGWESFGSGRTLVGVDSSDSDFDTAEETGGEKTHTLTVDEIPGHNHMGRIYSHNYNTGQTIPQGRAFANSFNLNGSVNGSWGYSNSGDVTNSEIVKTIESDYTGGNGTHNNLQPYITVYFWKRIN